MKKCPQCNEIKELADFSKDKRRKDGHACWCKECNSAYLRARYKADPVKHAEQGKQWRLENPLYRKTANLRDYGLTIEQFDIMRKQQNYCCAICNINEDKLPKKLHVDHNHDTGKVRGLLCGNCNTALGLLKENLFIMHSMRKYCRKHSTELADNTNEKVG